MNTSALRWAYRHPLEAAREFPVVVAHAPTMLREQRITTTKPSEATEGKARAALDEAKVGGAIPDTWALGSALPTESNVVVLQLGAAGEPRSALLKIAQNASGNGDLEKQRLAIQSLFADPQLEPWRHFAPELLAQGQVDGSDYVVERAINGVDLTKFPSESTWLHANEEALQAISQLHELGGQVRVVDEQLLSAWIDPALDAMRAIPVGSSSRAKAVDKLRGRLHRELVGRATLVGRVHGDYHAGNVIVDEHTGDVNGVIDWDRAGFDRPAFLDLARIGTSTHLHKSGERFGSTVRDLARGVEIQSPELSVLRSHLEAQPGDEVDFATVVLMMWLHHVGGNLGHSRYGSHRVWVHRTVDVVLSAFA